MTVYEAHKTDIFFLDAEVMAERQSRTTSMIK